MVPVYRPPQPVVYCDLDGVLCDFVRACCDAFNEPWAKIKPLIDSNVGWKWLRENHRDTFWHQMNWHPEGRHLWSSIKSLRPVILTAAPATWPESRRGKIMWCAEHLGTYVKVITCTRVEKQQYAVSQYGMGLTHPNVLIDDNEKNIAEWNAAGGFGILYKGNSTVAAMQARSFILPWTG